jgi:hypothetical protein
MLNEVLIYSFLNINLKWNNANIIHIIPFAFSYRYKYEYTVIAI